MEREIPGAQLTRSITTPQSMESSDCTHLLRKSKGPTLMRDDHRDTTFYCVYSILTDRVPTPTRTLSHRG